MKKRKKKAGGKEKGFTFLEILIVSFILPLLFLSIYSVLDAANVIFHTNNVFAELNRDAMQTLRYVSREIGQTSPNVSPARLTIAADVNNNSVVTFQIPVDCDNDGDAVDDEGASCVQDADTRPDAEWGAYSEIGQTQDGNLDFWTRYSVSNGQLIREVLDDDLNEVQGLSRVVANNVETFTAVQAQNTLTLTVTLIKTNAIGQMGGARDYQTSFSSSTILRNAVA